ncbi:MAG: bifunctional tRNA (5-methylaminomethyl-2-thiouridine)(34)-methyltransferase MnmD/FAD-dependent 5-carboxymethylaminomethyl-2-thiouridine(34) oxidoreductase MnmC [Halieaceae bacterium]|jgi:tRNA 5-methylaminomethyl-2-thiouridine biosynthesis bifunctional protein|nr:bifunctional tRNA (5-methylaminomethyl-2-thiouridine)(34)-methyltransferase MnmD/FAD-dependent 5-carboxymethylaminomethyl-2-thiouridine(34) oxidoreductase MnmC [Halieaceae bacterium]
MSGGDESGLRGAHCAELTWADGVPRSTHFQDTYFSSAGGIAESRHVFLAGNDLPARWRGCDHFTIAETGFGTGLNFLNCWQAWQASREQRPGNARLHYLSIEGFPLRPEDLAIAADAWPQLETEAAALARDYPPPLPGLHRLWFDDVCLDLVFAELEPALAMLETLPDLAVDAWFLDGFAPARNPDMWSSRLFQVMATLGQPDSSFATFTAAGDVRRGLEAAGFTVEKTPGFGRKRDMLRGVLSSAAAPPAPSWTPWHLASHRYSNPGRPLSDTARPASALVLGAGLAGAFSAEALARRGVPVTVLERGEIAGAASGNLQGALYTRLSHRESALTSFSLHSFCYAVRRYRSLLESGVLTAGRDGDLCGALHLRPDWGVEDVLHDTVASLPGLVQGLDAGQAEQVSGIAGCGSGLFYPESGWLYPGAVCRALLNAEPIRVLEQCGPLTLHPCPPGWQVRNQEGTVLAEAECAIVACGTDSATVAGTEWLRLQPIRGQTSQVESRGTLAALRTVICHEGYLPPAREGEHCLGATFDIDDTDPTLRAADHLANIEQVARALPALQADLPLAHADQLAGRVGHRCATPDYLPVAGPVPDLDPFCEDYAALRRDARQVIPGPGSYLPGLYLCAGHGSRGLTSTPLCGELLAAQACGEAWPIPAELARALAPARFLVRELKRNIR